MKPSPLARMDSWIRYCLPVGFILVFVLLTTVPTRLTFFGGLAPLLPLIGVYYWAIYRPDLLPSWLAFVIGLVHDIITGMPLGISALVLLLVRGLVVSQRKFFLGKSFAVQWWAFCLLAAGAATLSWVLVMMVNKSVVDPTAALVQYLATVGLFPLLTWILARTQMAFLKDV